MSIGAVVAVDDNLASGTGTEGVVFSIRESGAACVLAAPHAIKLQAKQLMNMMVEKRGRFFTEVHVDRIVCIIFRLRRIFDEQISTPSPDRASG